MDTHDVCHVKRLGGPEADAIGDFVQPPFEIAEHDAAVLHGIGLAALDHGRQNFEALVDAGQQCLAFGVGRSPVDFLGDREDLPRQTLHRHSGNVPCAARSSTRCESTLSLSMISTDGRSWTTSSIWRASAEIRASMR